VAAPHIPEERLITGERMSREEFLRRWDALPGLKNAELIEGTVCVASHVSSDHGEVGAPIGAWLMVYSWATAGCKSGHNATWMMLGSAPQPDLYLAILPEYGGQSRFDGKYRSGAPELVIEICISSTEVDFGPKLALYQRSGVREYITIELFTQRIIWRLLENGSYRELAAESDTLRSVVFPGLWLHTPAFWSGDGETMRAVLEQGLASQEHAAFVQQLKANHQG
jgi:Uma2 family endonuclease